ncbi:MAG: hypothetical protein HY904_23710 [Deltaproteobacteria bacterium]|nr:hypothetical protein [Deltaproteobacteria bacterium]
MTPAAEEAFSDDACEEAPATDVAVDEGALEAEKPEPPVEVPAGVAEELAGTVITQAPEEQVWPVSQSVAP